MDTAAAIFWSFSNSHEQQKLCAQYPEDSLMFLNLVVGDDVQWVSRDLQECLNDIKQTNPKLATDNSFERLFVLARRNAIG